MSERNGKMLVRLYQRTLFRYFILAPNGRAFFRD
jgi:hypothetical protein